MPHTQRPTPSSPRRLPSGALSRAARRWRLPPLSGRICPADDGLPKAPLSFIELARLAKSRLSGTADKRARSRLELTLIDWLSDTVRLNIKRGRLFEIDRVLTYEEADCLGYALLVQHIGKKLGLDIGIVEVVIDNAGRPVPHVVNMVTLSDGRRRFIDLWHGSTNIRHRRLGLMVKQAGRWRVVDADWQELRHFQNLKGLPPQCVCAISDYMTGNQHLERGIQLRDAAELHEAIDCYAYAIERSPLNARMYFNRAIAFENLGNRRAAEADYAVALRDEASLIRVQARQHPEVVRLMALDRMELNARHEEVYLLRKGFVTGRAATPERIAARYHMSPDEVNRIVSRIESMLLTQPVIDSNC